MSRISIHLEHEESRTQDALYQESEEHRTLVNPLLFRLLRARLIPDEPSLNALFQRLLG